MPNRKGMEVTPLGGTGEPEIVVTSQMREAGASVIQELRDVVSPSGLAEEVYIAMARAAIEASSDPF